MDTFLYRKNIQINYHIPFAMKKIFRCLCLLLLSGLFFSSSGTAQELSMKYVESREYPEVANETFRILNLIRDNNYAEIGRLTAFVSNSYQWQGTPLRKRVRWMSNRINKRGIPPEFTGNQSSVGAWLAKEKMTMTRMQAGEDVVIIASLHYSHKKAASKAEAIHFVFDEHGTLLKMTVEAPRRQMAKFRGKTRPGYDYSAR